MYRHRRLGSLGLALLVVVGSLVLGAVPAMAVPHDPVIGLTHYANVGNPGLVPGRQRDRLQR